MEARVLPTDKGKSGVGCNSIVETAQEQRYSAADLVDVAAGLGLAATNRLILDWVNHGLLDQPERRGLGRGNGSTAYWSRPQVDLFVDLLAFRQRKDDPVRSVAALANLPVFGWLYGAPGIPLRQVRRALWTWSGRSRQKTNTALADAKRTAAGFVKTVAHPDSNVHDQARLREFVIETLRDRSKLDPDELRELVRPVLDPHGDGPHVGPAGIRVDVDLFVGLTEARLVAMRDLATYTDAEYEHARETYIHGHAAYAQDQPDLAREREFGHMFVPQTFEIQLQGACVNLITILGLIRTTRPPNT
jgi:hypothetical protein